MRRKRRYRERRYKKVKKERKGIKSWLEENKIFFEIFSTVLLGILSFAISIVSLVVSFSGLKTANNTMKIYEKQLEIEENNREPYFVLEKELINEDIEKNKEDYKYILKNIGGQILWANLLVRTYVEIYIDSVDFRCQIPMEYYVKGQNTAVYNKDDKSFSFCSIYYGAVETMSNDLLTQISNLIDCPWSSMMKSYVDILYTDYKNESFHNTYILNSDRIEISKKSEDNFIDLGKLDYDNIESIAEKVKNELDKRQNLEKNEDIEN